MHFEWGDFDKEETLEHQEIGYYINFAKNFKVTGISGCSLEVTDTYDFKYDLLIRPKGEDWFIKEWKKVNWKISIPLDKIILDKLAPFENANLEHGPLQKWGVQFVTKEKQIDFDETEVSKRLGFDKPYTEQKTFSTAGYTAVIGTRPEAAEFYSKVRSLAEQCN